MGTNYFRSAWESVRVCTSLQVSLTTWDSEGNKDKIKLDFSKQKQKHLILPVMSLGVPLLCWTPLYLVCMFECLLSVCCRGNTLHFADKLLSEAKNNKGEA